VIIGHCFAPGPEGPNGAVEVFLSSSPGGHFEAFGTSTSGFTAHGVDTFAGVSGGGTGIESYPDVGFQVVARDDTVSDKFSRIDVRGARIDGATSCRFGGMTIPSS